MSTPTRTALVTGATGSIGTHLVPALLDEGWQVRVLSRSGTIPAQWRGRVRTITGDASNAEDVAAALDGADVAYYLLHSMDGKGSYRKRDKAMAQTFAEAARQARTDRIVYLSGLHPTDEKLSGHLASRAEVGEIFLAAATPAAVLQAGMVLGANSASFQMLRHLTERLPLAFGPKWLKSTVTPIALSDVIYYLVRAADLPAEVNRTFDLGMDERLRYLDMMKRYAQVTGLRTRHIGTVPVLTPRLASYWVSLITPVSSGVARPLVGSLKNEAIVHERDAEHIMGVPEDGLLRFDDAVLEATKSYDPMLWSRTLRRVGLAVGATAVVGSLFTAPGTRWYNKVDKPSWQPPSWAFPTVWTGLYAGIALASAATIADLHEAGQPRAARGYSRALTVNLVLNAGWSGVFFRGKAPATATFTAAALTASSADLTRRAARVGKGKAATLLAYTAWCGFATALTWGISRRNR